MNLTVWYLPNSLSSVPFNDEVTQTHQSLGWSCSGTVELSQCLLLKALLSHSPSCYKMLENLEKLNPLYPLLMDKQLWFSWCPHAVWVILQPSPSLSCVYSHRSKRSLTVEKWRNKYLEIEYIFYLDRVSLGGSLYQITLQHSLQFKSINRKAVTTWPFSHRNYILTCGPQ